MRQQKSKTITYTESICDICGAKDSDVRIKKCEICRRDVCSQCAIRTDTDSLEGGWFHGDYPDYYCKDYPDYYCKDCWEKGKELRDTILQLRQRVEEAEGNLWTKWKELCLGSPND